MLIFLRQLSFGLVLITQSAAPWPADGPDGGASQVHVHIERLLDSRELETLGERVYMQDLLREIYAADAYRPLWTSADKVGQMLSLMRDSASHGLQPHDYHLQLIEKLNGSMGAASGPGELASLDILLTDGLLLYAYHRRYGKVKAHDLDANINFKREAFSDTEPAEAVRQALEAEDLPAFVDSLAPAAEYYDGLRAQLLRYRELAAGGGWPEVPAGPTLRLGDRDSRVIPLRQRLQIEGELPPAAGSAADQFDAELELAVRNFQERYGLDSDGLAGQKTIAAMNIPARARVDQLRLSLERLRWVAQEADEVFIAVNIAGFRVSFVRQRKVIWTSRVIIGTAYRKTPVFRADITYVEFNPTWTVPPTILREDTLPALKRDPAYLKTKNLSVFDSSGRRVDPATIDWTAFGKTMPFTLRQEPGPNNALGRVKLIFPNPHFVFMHDTPQRELFMRPERTFSSGCIRVEDALALAKLLLEDTPAFNPASLQSVLDAGRTRRVVLAKPIPVLILYLTAALDASGKARFYQDVYQRDAAELRALDGAVTVDLPRPR